MTKNIDIKINCDSCSQDISPHKTSYPHQYILKVSSEDISINNGVVYAVMIIPPIEDLYFCGIGCLKKWCEDK